MSVNETNETNETGVGGARADMLAHMGSLQQAPPTRARSSTRRAAPTASRPSR